MQQSRGVSIARVGILNHDLWHFRSIALVNNSSVDAASAINWLLLNWLLDSGTVVFVRSEKLLLLGVESFTFKVFQMDFLEATNVFAMHMNHESNWKEVH